MTWEDYLDSIRHDGERLTAVAEFGLTAVVSSCPGWTVRDLVVHTGGVHRHKTQIVAERLDHDPPWPQAPADGLVDWFRQGLSVLVATLADTHPSTPVYSWYPPDQSAGFWYRRMAHETLIHRVDAELANGEVSPIDPDLAADGVDEALRLFVGRVPDWGTFTPDGRTVRLEASDTNRTWDVEFGRFVGTSPTSGVHYDTDAVTAETDVVTPDATVSGGAVDLDLWLWGRGPIDRLAVAGNVCLVHDLRAIAAEEM